MLDNIITEQINKYLNENLEQEYGEYPTPTIDDFRAGNMVTLYRVAFKDQVDSIFKYGYDREFTGSKGGNMYGAGVYCTNNLRDSINNVKTKPEYGNCIIKMFLIGGYDKFLIFSESMAKQQYGNNWEIENQIKSIVSDPRIAQEMINQVSNSCRNSGLNPYHGRTAPIAHDLFRRYKNEFKKFGVRGLVYKGNRDGHCSLPYDFSAVIPFAVSYDQGRTFKEEFNQDTYDRMTKSCDAEFRYGQKYKTVMKPVEGYAMVEDENGKWNYIDIDNDQPISPYWFDYCSMIDPKNECIFDFTYKGINFHGDPAAVINNDYDGYLCEYTELDDMTNKILANIARRKANKGQ